MTNFRDPATQQKDYAALLSFWHTANGIYIWEYVTTLHFEFDIIRGRRPYRWTIWIYSLARGSILIAVILNLVSLNVKTRLNCQALITLQVAAAYVSLVSASLLIIVRIVAIWDKNKIAVTIAVITWVTNVSVIIQGVARLRTTWDSTLQTCITQNYKEIRPTLLITVITDTLLFVTMLVGLFPLLTERGCAFGVGRLLWKQGIIWLLIVTVAGIPPTVFIFLNLNVPLNVMFQLPSVITNTIAATRIYRSLVDYTLESSNISMKRIEVAVDTAYEQYPTSRTTISVGVQRGDKPRELSVGSGLESSIETGYAM